MGYGIGCPAAVIVDFDTAGSDTGTVPIDDATAFGVDFLVAGVQLDLGHGASPLNMRPLYHGVGILSRNYSGYFS